MQITETKAVFLCLARVRRRRCRRQICQQAVDPRETAAKREAKRHRHHFLNKRCEFGFLREVKLALSYFGEFLSSSKLKTFSQVRWFPFGPSLCSSYFRLALAEESHHPLGHVDPGGRLWKAWLCFLTSLQEHSDHSSSLGSNAFSTTQVFNIGIRSPNLTWWSARSSSVGTYSLILVEVFIAVTSNHK